MDTSIEIPDGGILHLMCESPLINNSDLYLSINGRLVNIATDSVSFIQGYTRCILTESEGCERIHAVILGVKELDGARIRICWPGVNCTDFEITLDIVFPSTTEEKSSLQPSTTSRSSVQPKPITTPDGTPLYSGFTDTRSGTGDSNSAAALEGSGIAALRALLGLIVVGLLL